MRYYLIIGKLGNALQAAVSIFEEQGDFKCVHIIEEMKFNWNNLQFFPPELVIINLDDPNLKFHHIKEKLNHNVGIIPKYIGITESQVRGFEAYQAGFVDVILAPFTTGKLLTAFNKYRYNHRANTIYCIDWYHDYLYINLNEVILVKADNYTSEFLMKDGSTIRNFKNLKNTHQDLPINFQRVHRSWIVNAYYVYRINMHKNSLYLRHFKKPITYTKSYKNNIIEIKKMVMKAPIYFFLIISLHGLIPLIT